MNGAKLAKLTTFLKIWHSTRELSEKLEKFKEAGFGDQIKTVGDLVAFIVEQSNEAYSGFIEGSIALAKAKGQKEAAEALEGRLASLKKVATVLAAYELVKSISD